MQYFYNYLLVVTVDFYLTIYVTLMNSFTNIRVDSFTAADFFSLYVELVYRFGKNLYRWDFWFYLKIESEFFPTDDCR